MNDMSQYPPRPRIDETIIRNAAIITARLLPELTDKQIAEIADAIVEFYNPGDNGYELAKKIDGNIQINIDVEFVEAMDAMSSFVADLYKQVCWRWVEKHNIHPPLPTGAQIEEGIIDSVCEYSPATYQVKVPGESGRLLIKFEHAKLKQAEPA